MSWGPGQTLILLTVSHFSNIFENGSLFCRCPGEGLTALERGKPQKKSIFPLIWPKLLPSWPQDGQSCPICPKCGLSCVLKWAPRAPRPPKTPQRLPQERPSCCPADFQIANPNVRPVTMLSTTKGVRRYSRSVLQSAAYLLVCFGVLDPS